MIDQRHKKWIANRFPIFYTMDLNLQVCFSQAQLSLLESEIKEVPIQQLSKKSKTVYKKLKKKQSEANNKFKSNRALYKILSTTSCHQLNEIILNSQKIRSLEPLANKQFKKLTELQLNSNQIGDFYPLCLSKFPSITHFHLNQNCLKMLKGIQTCSWEKLKYVDLSKNNIQTIENLMCAQFSNIQRLLLHHNKITSLNSFAKSSFRKIKYLDLSFNPINALDNFPRSIFIKLSELNLKNNPICDLNELQKIQMTTIRRDQTVDKVQMKSSQFVFFDYKIIFSKLFLKNQMQKLTMGTHSKHIGCLYMTVYKAQVKMSYQNVSKIYFYQ